MPRGAKKITVRIKSRAKNCPGSLLDCPDEAKVEQGGERRSGTELIQDETDPAANALKAKEDALKRQKVDLQKQKQVMAIKRANQRLQDLNREGKTGK